MSDDTSNDKLVNWVARRYTDDNVVQICVRKGKRRTAIGWGYLGRVVKESVS